MDACEIRITTWKRWFIYIYTYIRPYRVISIVYRVSYIYSLYIYTHPIYISYIYVYTSYIYIQYPLSIGFQPSQIGADEIIPSRGSPRCHRSTELFHGGSGGAEVPRSVFFAGYSIGLRENLNRKPMGFYHQIWGLSCKFSHHPILWFIQMWLDYWPLKVCISLYIHHSYIYMC